MKSSEALCELLKKTILMLKNGDEKWRFITLELILNQRLKDNILSLGWGGGNDNLDLKQNVDFKIAYPKISSRRINSIKKIKTLKDGDILVAPKLPKNGKFIIGVVDGNFPDCYSYIENDKTHLNHCIKLKKVYGLNGELDIHNVKVREWYAKLRWMRLPIYPLSKYSTIFINLVTDLENDANSVFEASKLGDFIENLHDKIWREIKKEFEEISPSNSHISFEKVCKEIIETYGYKLEKSNHHKNGGDADLIFSIEETENENPFIRKENKLYVQVKKHKGISNEKAVQQLIDIIAADKAESVQGCAITLGTFSEEAENLADENNIILIDGDDIVNYFIKKLL